MFGMKGSMSTLLAVFVIPMAKFTPRRPVIPFRTPTRLGHGPPGGAVGEPTTAPV